MAVTAPSGLRITIGERSWDVEEGTVDVALEISEAGARSSGSALLTSPNGRPRRLLWAEAPGSAVLEVIVDGWRFEATVEDLGRARLRERARREAAAAAHHAPLVIRAPIPGRISSVRVTEGDAVESGAALVTLDAMKMENVVRAPRAGTIGRVAVAADQTVELGDMLLELA